MTAQHCVSGDWQEHGGRLIVPSRGVYRLLPVPASIQLLYRQALALTGECCKPALAWTASLGGYGGLYLGTAIALGRDDLQALTDTVWQDYVTHVSGDALQLARFCGLEIVSYQQAYQAVAGYVIAHELGHARQASDGFRGTALAAEADAEVYAGLLGTALGFNCALQRYAAHATGCTGPFCQHPDPDQRVALWDRGAALYHAAA